MGLGSLVAGTGHQVVQAARDGEALARVAALDALTTSDSTLGGTIHRTRGTGRTRPGRDGLTRCWCRTAAPDRR